MKRVVGIAAAGLGVAGYAAFGSGSEPLMFQHHARSDLQYITTQEPLTKRQRRRMRGKAKP